MKIDKPINMKIAVDTFPHTLLLKNGSIPIEGVNADFVKVEPILAAYRRMVRTVEFDACELASTTYFIARAFGAPFKALPIFTKRSFHHSGLVYREDAGIKTPKDLEGKKVGVRAYSVTTGVWTRGILASEYGLDTDKVTWVVDDEEHVTQLQLPPNVMHVPEGESLVSMMASGTIQAGFTSRAGIGRQAPRRPAGRTIPKRRLKSITICSRTRRNLKENGSCEGIYPIHGVMVVKDNLLDENPWLAKSLYTAFSKAKEPYIAKLRSGKADSAEDKRYIGLYPPSSAMTHCLTV